MSAKAESSGKSAPSRKRGRQKQKQQRNDNKNHQTSRRSSRTKALTTKERIMAPAKRHDPDGDPFYGVNVPAIQGLVQSKFDSARSYAKELISERSSMAKRNRCGPNMDLKWWSVNLFICLVPSMMIAGYCEWTRPEMEAYFNEADEREKKRILGGDEAGGPEQEVGGEQDTASKDPPPPPSTVEKLTEAVMVLLGYNPAHQQEEGSEVASHGSDRVIKKGGALAKGGTVAGSGPPVSSSGSEDRGGGTDTTFPAAHSTAASDTSSSVNPLPSTASPSSIGDLHDLLLRIESLERRLAEKNARNNADADADADASSVDAEDQRRQQQERQRRKLEHAHQYALKRATAQSGIQNRVDDALMAKWEEEDEERRRQDGEIGAPEKVSMTRFAAEAVKRWAVDYGEELTGAVRGYVLKSVMSTNREETGAIEVKEDGDTVLDPSPSPGSRPNPSPAPSTDFGAAMVAANRASASAATAAQTAAEMAGRAAEAAKVAAAASSPEEVVASARRASEEASSAAASVSSSATQVVDATDAGARGERTVKGHWPGQVWAWGASWIFRRAEDARDDNVVREERTERPQR